MDRWGFGRPRPWLGDAPACRSGGALLRHRWAHPWTALVGRRGAPAAPTHGPAAGARLRFAPHQLRLSKPTTEARRNARDHPHIQHTNLGVTSVYLQGIDNAEIIATVHAHKAPMIPASTGLWSG